MKYFKIIMMFGLLQTIHICPAVLYDWGSFVPAILGQAVDPQPSFKKAGSLEYTSFAQNIYGQLGTAAGAAYTLMACGLSDLTDVSTQPTVYYDTNYLSSAWLGYFATALGGQSPMFNVSPINLEGISEIDQNYIAKHLIPALQNLNKATSSYVNAQTRETELTFKQNSFNGVVVTEIFNNTQTTFNIEQGGTLIGQLVPGKNDVALYGATFTPTGSNNDIVFVPLNAQNNVDTTKGSWRISFQTGSTVLPLAPDAQDTATIGQNDPFFCVQITSADLPQSWLATAQNAQQIQTEIVRTQCLGLSTLSTFMTIALKIEDYVVKYQGGELSVIDQTQVPCFYPSIVYVQTPEVLKTLNSYNMHYNVRVSDYYSKIIFPILFFPSSFNNNQQLTSWAHMVNLVMLILQLNYNNYAGIMDQEDLWNVFFSSEMHAYFEKQSKMYVYRQKNNNFGVIQQNKMQTLASLITNTPKYKQLVSVFNPSFSSIVSATGHRIQNFQVLLNGLVDSASGYILNVMPAGFIGSAGGLNGDVPTDSWLNWYVLFSSMQAGAISGQSLSLNMNIDGSDTTLPDAYVTLQNIMTLAGKQGIGQSQKTIKKYVLDQIFSSNSFSYQFMLDENNIIRSGLTKKGSSSMFSGLLNDDVFGALALQEQSNTLSIQGESMPLDFAINNVILGALPIKNIVGSGNYTGYTGFYRPEMQVATISLQGKSYNVENVSTTQTAGSVLFGYYVDKKGGNVNVYGFVKAAKKSDIAVSPYIQPDTTSLVNMQLSLNPTTDLKGNSIVAGTYVQPYYIAHLDNAQKGLSYALQNPFSMISTVTYCLQNLPAQVSVKVAGGTNTAIVLTKDLINNGLYEKGLCIDQNNAFVSFFNENKSNTNGYGQWKIQNNDLSAWGNPIVVPQGTTISSLSIELQQPSTSAIQIPLASYLSQINEAVITSTGCLISVEILQNGSDWQAVVSGLTAQPMSIPNILTAALTSPTPVAYNTLFTQTVPLTLPEGEEKLSLNGLQIVIATSNQQEGQTLSAGGKIGSQMLDGSIGQVTFFNDGLGSSAANGAGPYFYYFNMFITQNDTSVIYPATAKPVSNNTTTKKPKAKKYKKKKASPNT